MRGVVFVLLSVFILPVSASEKEDFVSVSGALTTIVEYEKIRCPKPANFSYGKTEEIINYSKGRWNKTQNPEIFHAQLNKRSGVLGTQINKFYNEFGGGGRDCETIELIVNLFSTLQGLNQRSETIELSELNGIRKPSGVDSMVKAENRKIRTAFGNSLIK